MGILGMNMIEQVARAICVAHSDDPDRFDAVWQELAWVQYEDHAKAAMSAMQEPTEGMMDRMDQMLDVGADCNAVWSATVQAALDEK
jgi:uncharacterized protein with von Willebrand factor type A (vWA) domain